MLARIRKDLREAKLLPTVQTTDHNGYFVDMPLPLELLESNFEYNQPDCLDDREYNSIICNLETMKAFRIKSIDLEFGETESSYAIMVTRSITQKKELTVTATSYEEAVKKVEVLSDKIEWDTINVGTENIVCA